jgi:hypothetical protein
MGFSTNRKNRVLCVPATPDTDTPVAKAAGISRFLVFPMPCASIRPRIVPNLPCKVASISPRFGPARSVIFSTSAWITSAASLRLSGLLSASVSRSTFFLTDTGHVRMDVRNIRSFLRQKSLNHVLARLEFAHTFGHARVCPPSSITISICFKVRWKFGSSELDAGDDARVISPPCSTPNLQPQPLAKISNDPFWLQSGRLARSEVICAVWSGLPGHWLDSIDSGIGHSIPSFSEIIRGIAIQRYSRIRTGRQVPDNCRFRRLRCGRRSGGKMS